MNSTSKTQLRIGMTLVALGATLLVVLAGLDQLRSRRAADEPTRLRIEQNRTRLRALADARREPERFDTLLASLAATSSAAPDELRRAVSEIERLRAAERAGRSDTGDLARAIEDLDARLESLEEPPNDTLTGLLIGSAGLLLLLVGFPLTVFSLRRFAKEREAIAIIVDLDTDLAHDGRLADAVRRRVYAERLEALRSRERPVPVSATQVPPQAVSEQGPSDFGLIAIPEALLDPDVGRGDF